MIRLTVTTGGTSKEYALAEEMISIGRSSENLIKLEDAKASRRHATIFRSEGAYRVSNLESKNGIILNGRMTDAGPIEVGTVIQIGETQISVTAIELPKPAELPVPTARAIVSHRPAGYGRLIIACAGGSILALLIWIALLPKPDEIPPQLPPQIPPQIPPVAEADDGRSALERLKARATKAERVTPDLVDEAIALGRKHNAAWLTKTDSSGTPFDQLLNTLLQRRAEEFVRRFASTRAEIDVHLDAGRYGKAIALTTAFRDDEDEMFIDTVEAMPNTPT